MKNKKLTVKRALEIAAECAAYVAHVKDARLDKNAKSLARRAENVLAREFRLWEELLPKRES